MSAEGDLWGSLSRAAAEAGRVVRGAAESAATELSGAFGKDQQRVRWPGGLFSGPIIPVPYKQGQEWTPTWQDAYLASCAVSAARVIQQHALQPATSALVAVQAAIHARGGYRLLQVGFNSHRVLRHHEWRRLVSAPLVHHDLTHLASNCTGLLLEGLPLERRLGSAGLLCLVATTGALTQGLYLLATRLATAWLPNSMLANDYYMAFSVGFSGVTMALKVIGGYVREADLALAQAQPPDDFIVSAGRLAAWPSLLLSQLLIPGASLVGHVCGIAAGVLHVYGAAALRRLSHGLGIRTARRRLANGRLVAVGGGAALELGGAAAHPRLGWPDLLSQVAMGVGSCVVAVLALRARESSGRK